MRVKSSRVQLLLVGETQYFARGAQLGNRRVKESEGTGGGVDGVEEGGNQGESANAGDFARVCGWGEVREGNGYSEGV